MPKTEVNIHYRGSNIINIIDTPQGNRERGSYAERITHAFAIGYLTYTTYACVFNTARGNIHIDTI